jgi:hypothetical protein
MPISLRLFALACCLASASACSTSRAEPKPPTRAPTASLDVRELNIVDEQGRVRMRLGAPLPMGDSSSGQRRVKASGIQFLDESGREIGGLAMMGDGSVRALCFDYRLEQAAGEGICFSLIKDHAEIVIGDPPQRGKPGAARIAVGVRDGVASVTLNDAAEKPRLQLSVDKGGQAHVTQPK